MNTYLLIVAASMCSLGIAWYMIPNIILISFKKNLFDYSSGRKVHKGIVPRLGGLAFTPAIIISLALVEGIATLFCGVDLYISFVAQTHVGLLMCALLLLYFEGTADDLIGVPYRAKFVYQIISAVLVVVSGIYINDFYGLFGVWELPHWVGAVFSVVLIVFIINALNLIDGIDGLASGLSIIALIFFGFIYIYQQEWLYAAISFVTCGALLPFFVYNVFGSAEHRHKIFMGDAGSQTIGLILAVLAVRLSQKDPALVRSLPDAIVVAFSLLMVPCFDVVRVIIHRLRNHKNPFKPDMNHIHHKLLALGLRQRVAMPLILGVAVFFAALNLLLVEKININLLLLIDIVLWTILNVYLSMMIRRRKPREESVEAPPSEGESE